MDTMKYYRYYEIIVHLSNLIKIQYSRICEQYIIYITTCEKMTCNLCFPSLFNHNQYLWIFISYTIFFCTLRIFSINNCCFKHNKRKKEIQIHINKRLLCLYVHGYYKVMIDVSKNMDITFTLCEQLQFMNHDFLHKWQINGYILKIIT
jgi:hypothetical protein